MACGRPRTGHAASIGFHAKQCEERSLRGLERELKICLAAHHERRHVNPRRKIQRIYLLGRAYSEQSATEKHRRLQAGLDRTDHDPDHGAEADAVIPDPLAVEILSRLDVVDDPPEILDAGDCDVPKRVRTSLRGAAFVGALVNRKDEGPSATDDELDIGQVQLPARAEQGRVTPRKIDDGLIRRRRRLREIQVRDHALLAVGRVEGHGLPAPVRRILRSLEARVERPRIVAIDVSRHE